MILNQGKAYRVRRLYDNSGAIFAVPMDHGFTIGPVKGLINIDNTVRNIFSGGASCVIVHKGLIKSIFQQIPRSNGLIVHLSGSTNLSPKSTFKISTGSVLEACKLGADAISCHVNIGVDNDFEMIENMSKFTTEANNYGIPVLAMMYVRNNVGIDNNNPDALAHAARIAEESGADIVKINMTPNIKDFDEVLQGMGIPVVVAGGSRMDNFDEFISRIKYSIISGATGISIGRNIFQSNDPSKAMSSIKEAVIEGLKETDRYENFSNS